MVAAEWREPGIVYPSPWVFTERLYLYSAGGLRHVGSAPEPSELFELRWRLLADAVAMALDRRIDDAKSIIPLLRCRAPGAAQPSPPAAPA